MQVGQPVGVAVWGGSVGLAVAERSPDVSGAGVGAVSGLPCDVDECAHKCNVEDNGEEGEEGNTAEAQGEDNGEEEVEDCGA